MAISFYLAAEHVEQLEQTHQVPSPASITTPRGGDFDQKFDQMLNAYLDGDESAFASVQTPRVYRIQLPDQSILAITQIVDAAN